MAVDFDLTYKEELIDRLRGLTPETQPKWGRMTADDLIPHFAFVIRYSMGQGKPAFFGNWFTRRVFGPLIFNGILKIPKNVKLPMPDYSTETVRTPDDFSALLDEYFSAVENGALNTNPHPAFGDIGVDGWSRFHVKHFEHHLKQFGL